MKPIYRSIWWPKVHQILVWTPSPLEVIGAGGTYADVRENMTRVVPGRRGHFYDPSSAYKRKISKMARKGRLPTYIQRDE